VFGGLQDKDRIFTNIYGRHDPFIKVGGGAGQAAAALAAIAPSAWAH